VKPRLVLRGLPLLRPSRNVFVVLVVQWQSRDCFLNFAKLLLYLQTLQSCPLIFPPQFALAAHHFRLWECLLVLLPWTLGDHLLNQWSWMG
jgi:hypothetical protein